MGDRVPTFANCATLRTLAQLNGFTGMVRLNERANGNW